MEAKEYLTNRHFCPLPWSGLVYNPNGSVANCTRSNGLLGNIKDSTIEEILHSSKNIGIKELMLANNPGPDCYGCYDKEQGKNSFDIISDRIFYLKELREVDRTLYSEPTNYNLHKIDVRWSNLCNFACVYCGPELSSKWATELDMPVERPAADKLDQLKAYIFEHASELKHVYLAGGEPLLMKENFELLTLLQEVNPNVHLRVNTNLSKVDTRIFNLVCEFKNVHWIVSVESIEAEYEYIRYGGDWQIFLDNLKIIRSLDHKITFNMLHFILNYRSIFDCVDFLTAQGFHNNSFVISNLSGPVQLDVRNLPDTVLDSIKITIQDRISQNPKFLLEDGLKNMLQYIHKPFVKNIDSSLQFLSQLDQRRNISSRNTFKEFYSLIERQ